MGAQTTLSLGFQLLCGRLGISFHVGFLYLIFFDRMDTGFSTLVFAGLVVPSTLEKEPRQTSCGNTEEPRHSL